MCVCGMGGLRHIMQLHAFIDGVTRQLVKNLRNDMRKGLATETRRERVMDSLNKLYKHLTLQLNGTCS